jgi:hypothetical protein
VDTVTPLAFLSHSKGGKQMAIHLKHYLRLTGTDSFVAHEDIEPSQEWASVILEQLRACDVFFPILTSDFPKSDWADQETGVAVGLEKVIIPLKVDIDPYGFIAKYQAHRLRETLGAAAGWKLFKVMEKNEKLRSKVRGGLIRVFAGSGSFKEAGDIAGHLSEIESWDPAEIEAILKASTENDQIHHSYSAQRTIRAMISKYKNKMTARAKVYVALFLDIVSD